MVEIGARFDDRVDQNEELHLDRLLTYLDEYGDDGGDLGAEKKLEGIDSNDDSIRISRLKREVDTFQTDAKGVMAVTDRLEERNSQITSEFNAAKGHIATTDHIEVDRRDDSQKALVRKHPRGKKRPRIACVYIFAC